MTGGYPYDSGNHHKSPYEFETWEYHARKSRASSSAETAEAVLGISRMLRITYMLTCLCDALEQKVTARNAIKKLVSRSFDRHFSGFSLFQSDIRFSRQFPMLLIWMNNP